MSGLRCAAFIDLMEVDAATADRLLGQLVGSDALGDLVTRAVLRTPTVPGALPPGWVVATDASAAQACAWAFDAAAIADLPLLFLAAGATASADAVASLAEALDLDPMFGVAVPRCADAAGRVQLHLPFGPGAHTMPRRGLASLVDYQVGSDQIAPCLFFRRELVANLLFQPRDSLWTALADFVLRARRCGFRPVVCHRTVVPLVDSAAARSWGCNAKAIVTLRQDDGEFTSAPGTDRVLAERLVARLVDAPASLLLDARNLVRLHNGTSTAILNVCDALHRARPDAGVTLWLHPDAADWHDVRPRFRRWTIATEPPADTFAAGLRLSQPWHASDLDSLNQHAAVQAFWVLDTIAWDIGFAAELDLDATWQRLAADADALLFISDFSRQRFAHRFTLGPGVLTATCPLSMAGADYARPATTGGPDPGYWLVVGNRFDHKHVGPTVDLVARAFPTQRLVVFGDRNQPRAPRITRFESGEIDEATVQSCFARADVVVFPSFYEGFGLPIVQGLAYGRTVVARESALVHELATAYRGPGRLLTYATERDLVALLGRLTRGDLPDGLPLIADPLDAWTWDRAAARMLDTIDRLVADGPSPQMRRRTGLARGIHHPQRHAIGG